jgi:AraC-like DNA-binding protein
MKILATTSRANFSTSPLTRTLGPRQLIYRPCCFSLRSDEVQTSTGKFSSPALIRIVQRFGDGMLLYPAIASSSLPEWLERARAMIDASVPAGVRLDAIAPKLGVHRVHLSRSFARYFGCSVTEYIRRRRVHHAYLLLRNTRSTGSVIAATVGFADESHMGRAFKQVTGRSPSAFR